ncbi:MAG: gliding motility-associated C-terminal domain-containing protein, partial [Bacteroidales bacterium]|nr:gliding motility-associated C-terminal domain-containing protein [Bacteroidales bacterium]
HFGDGTIQKTCDELVEHVYTTAGCFDPFLIVMNRDLLECRDTAYLETCVFVDDMSKLEIPNIFSPNADGVNDFFQVKAQTLRTFSGMIVNRWGRTVYTWENWQDYEAGWDGTLDGGTKASPGVYYYIIKAEGIDGTPYEFEGALHLMRE